MNAVAMHSTLTPRFVVLALLLCSDALVLFRADTTHTLNLLMHLRQQHPCLLQVRGDGQGRGIDRCGCVTALLLPWLQL